MQKTNIDVSSHKRRHLVFLLIMHRWDHVECSAGFAERDSHSRVHRVDYNDELIRGKNTRARYRAPFGGSDQEGSVKSVKLWRRMLLSLKVSSKYPDMQKGGGRRQCERRDCRCVQGHMSRRQRAGRLRGNHRLTALMVIVRRVTRH